MQTGIILLTIAIYGLAGFLWWRERTPIYVVALVAGHLGSLPSPLWQALYRFSYSPEFVPATVTLFERTLPRIIFIGAWTSMLPPLVILYLHKYRWWFPGYLTGLLTFSLFVVYHLLIETIGVNQGWWTYAGTAPLPFGLRVTLLSAIMNGLVSLGVLSLLLLTRRYGLTSLLLLLLPMPLVLSLFVNGLLGAPLYTALLLQARNLASNWATVIGMLGTLGLLLWAAHTVASVIEGQRAGRQMI